jgi:hypothetical protein
MAQRHVRAMAHQGEYGPHLSPAPAAGLPVAPQTLHGLLAIPLAPDGAATADSSLRPRGSVATLAPQDRSRGAEHQRRIARHARIVLPVPYDVFGNENDTAGTREPQIDRIVRRGAQARRKTADFFQSAAPEHGCAERPDEVLRQPLAIQVRGVNLMMRGG